jgi:hypothetical protein
MKFESDIEVKHVENVLSVLSKCKIDGFSLGEALNVIRGTEYLLRQITDHKKPKDLGIVSTDEVAKKVTPLKPGKPKK